MKIFHFDYSVSSQANLSRLKIDKTMDGICLLTAISGLSFIRSVIRVKQENIVNPAWLAISTGSFGTFPEDVKNDNN